MTQKLHTARKLALTINVYIELAAARCTHPAAMAKSSADCCCFVVQVEDLKRFIPRLLHIRQAGTPAAGQAYGNVTSAQLLTDAFGVHS